MPKKVVSKNTDDNPHEVITINTIMKDVGAFQVVINFPDSITQINDADLRRVHRRIKKQINLVIHRNKLIASGMALTVFKLDDPAN